MAASLAAICSAFEEALGLSGAEGESDFFDLGYHSLPGDGGHLDAANRIHPDRAGATVPGRRQDQCGRRSLCAGAVTVTAPRVCPG